MKLVKKAIKFQKTEGTWSLIRILIPYIYNSYIRPLLPKTGRYSIKNEVYVNKERRVFDNLVPWKTPAENLPEYESAFCDAIRENVSKGEQIIVIGGGLGVSSVVAARYTGPHGSVKTFEASPALINDLKETMKLNKVNDRVSVKNSIISKAIHLSGNLDQDSSVDSVNVIPATEIPPCDTLLIDCDGAEINILSPLKIKPKLIIVEHHAVLDVNPKIPYQPDSIKNILSSLGYRVIDKKIKEIKVRKFGDEETIFVAKKTE